MHVRYWIVGLDTDRPEIALDLRNDDGSLAAETHTIRLDDVTKAQWTGASRLGAARRKRVVRVIGGDPFGARVATSTSLSGGGTGGSRTGSYDR